MKNSVSISVIVPVYQVSDYIERCLESVINQTYTNIECIIVDDATKDDSIVKCERLITEYDDKQNDNEGGKITFKIIHHEVNRGLSAARNTGTNVATGEYIYYLDSDDEITSDCIEKLMKAAQEHPEAEMVIGNYQEIKDGKRIRIMPYGELPPLIPSNELFVTYYHRHQISYTAWNKLVKRSFIEGNGLSFKEGILSEDFLWLFYVAKYLSAAAIVKDVTYNYYKRAGSIMESTDKHTVGVNYVTIYDDILHHLTIGRENKELIYCVERFSRHYLMHKGTIPAYKDLYRVYREQAWQHGCWYVYTVLLAVGFIGWFGNPTSLLSSLYTIRWKIKRYLG